MVRDASPKSPHTRHFLLSFLVGGAICMLGQALWLCFEALGCNEDEVRALVPMSLILLTAVSTAAGVFDKLAKHAGAGAGVPITGFANAIVSPSMEHKSEGFLLGVGANLFRLAGPVLAFGSAAAMLYGAIYYFASKGGG
ncbi:MAG: SpoVA/SpoVAEb family sporulation membrane protein [Oscillospiraceae bacterium]|jgi:stage V sporulation protein AC|nr:SpoVA/SpoVAEb family sporulation membrane protein [Oscillospiraceae bacterium]